MIAAGTGVLIAAALAATGASAAMAAGVPGSSGYLGAAEPFAVLGGSTVTNTGAPTSVWGDVGVSPGPAIVGFQTSQVGGTQHAADTTAANAQTALTDAYGAAAGATPSDTVDHSAIGNQTFLPGVYHASTSMDLTGTVTLDGRGDAAASWVFQAGSTLTTASSSRVVVINGNPCNVYWQVGSSATLGSSTSFIGTVMANASISAVTAASVQGRLLARTAAVTLDSNPITRPVCSLTDASGTTIPPTSATPTPSASASAAPSASASPSTPAPSASATPKASATPTKPAPSASATPKAHATKTPSTPRATTTPTTGTTTTTTGSGSGTGSSGSGTSGTSTGTSGSGSTTGTLATTGSDVEPPLALAGALLGLGSLLVAAPAVSRSLRRRRAARA